MADQMNKDRGRDSGRERSSDSNDRSSSQRDRGGNSGDRDQSSRERSSEPMQTGNR